MAINLYPVQEREVFIVRESAAGTIPATVGTPVPVTSFKPSDRPTWLEDVSMQGSMGDIYGLYQGPLIGSIDFGGNFTGDVFGHLPINLLGDWTTSGTASTPAGTLSAQVAAGATALPVASGGTSFTAGMYVWIQDSGTPAANEVVMVGSGSTTTSVVLDPTTPTRFAHASATPFVNSTGPYTHVFALLNGSVGAANGNAQPWTHTITDLTGIPGTYGAAQYSYLCVSELVITGNADKLLEWTAKATCYTRAIAASAVAAANVSSVQPFPAWRSLTGVGGPATGATQVKDVAEWQLTLTRALKPYNTNQGVQYPYAIGRGKQGAAFKMTVLPTTDESPLVDMLGNTQPQLQFVAANGLTGVNEISLQADVGLGAYKTADLDDSSELFGYTVDGAAVHTAASFGGVTMTGASGGKGAVKLTLINDTPIY